MKSGNGYEDADFLYLPQNGDGQKALFPVGIVTMGNIQCPEDSSLLECDPVSWVSSSVHWESHDQHHSITSQETWIFSNTTVRTSNLPCDTTFYYTGSSDCQSSGQRSNWEACNQLLHTLKWHVAHPPASYLYIPKAMPSISPFTLL
jgi:hypothetical protein